MARLTPSELARLLQAPEETLTIEHKGWLDLRDNGHKALLAKAIIGLANSGGGVIVLGTRKDAGQEGALGSFPRPEALARYTVDDINSVVQRFAEPEFHCELVFATHPGTGVEHAFVLVPGGHQVPIMACRNGPNGELQQRRCYVRKAGPRTEEPYTKADWDSVLERCLQARRESMLDAIRVIVQGHTGAGPLPPSARAQLRDFITASQGRWEALVAPLPADDPARMPLGHYTVAFSILGVEPVSLAELRRRMEVASRVKHTGWTPFIHLYRPAFEPRPVGGAIEVWLGAPDEERWRHDAAHCDYWRAESAGSFFQQRGYDEDSTQRVTPGKAMDITLPIWRVGEILLYASRLARLYAEDPTILVTCRYTGLQGRTLIRLDGFSDILERRRCVDDTAHLETQATARELDDNLVEVLHPLLSPLYERFGFFELTLPFVTREVERLKSSRF
jgi:hypothetical protein